MKHPKFLRAKRQGAGSMDRPGRNQQPMVRRALEVGLPMKIHNGIRYIRPMLADWPLYRVELRWLAIMMEMAASMRLYGMRSLGYVWLPWAQATV